MYIAGVRGDKQGRKECGHIWPIKNKAEVCPQCNRLICPVCFECSCVEETERRRGRKWMLGEYQNRADQII